MVRQAESTPSSDDLLVWCRSSLKVEPSSSLPGKTVHCFTNHDRALTRFLDGSARMDNDVVERLHSRPARACVADGIRPRFGWVSRQGSDEDDAALRPRDNTTLCLSTPRRRARNTAGSSRIGSVVRPLGAVANLEKTRAEASVLEKTW